MNSSQEDRYTCPHCDAGFRVCYRDPSELARETHSVPVACCHCRVAVLVTLSIDVCRHEVIVVADLWP